MSRRHELTDYEKGQIEGRSGTMSHAKIGDELGRPRRTVSSFLQRFRERQNKENLLRPGRPQKTIESDNRYLVYVAESDTEQPLKELRDVTNLNIFTQTIRRRLHEMGIQKWHAKKRALLTKEQAKKQYQWAKEHQHLTRDDFGFILFRTNRSLRKTTVTKSSYFDVKLHQKSMHHRIYKVKRRAQDYHRWYGDVSLAISLVHLFLLMARLMRKHMFSCFNKTSFHLLTAFKKIGAMQRQRGTFGFHEQGESTRLKIYFYVTAI